MSLDWHPKTPIKGPVSMDNMFAKRITVLSLLVVMGMVCGIFGLIQLTSAVSTNPPVVVFTEDGRTYYIDPEPYAMDTAALERHVQDMIYVLFTRTEKPYVERIKDYCTPSLLEKVELYYAGISELNPSGYYQTGKVLSAKLKESGPSRLKLNFEIFVDSRSATKSTQNTFYVATEFVYIGSTKSNPIGWNLDVIKRMNKSDYFAEENKEKLDQKTKIAN